MSSWLSCECTRHLKKWQGTRYILRNIWLTKCNNDSETEENWFLLLKQINCKGQVFCDSFRAFFKQRFIEVLKFTKWGFSLQSHIASLAPLVFFSHSSDLSWPLLTEEPVLSTRWSFTIVLCHNRGTRL